MSTDTEEMSAASVEEKTLRAGVTVAFVDYEAVVRSLREHEIAGGEFGTILRYLAAKDSVDTIAYIGAITKWRNLTNRYKRCVEEFEQFGVNV